MVVSFYSLRYLSYPQVEEDIFLCFPLEALGFSFHVKVYELSLINVHLWREIQYI